MSGIRMVVNKVHYLVHYDEDIYEIHFDNPETNQLQVACAIYSNEVTIWEADPKSDSYPWRQARPATPEEAAPFRAVIPRFWALHAAHQLRTAIAVADRAIPEVWKDEWDDDIDWAAVMAPVYMLERIAAGELSRPERVAAYAKEEENA